MRPHPLARSSRATRLRVASAGLFLLGTLVACSGDQEPTPAEPTSSPGLSDPVAPGPEVESGAASFAAPVGFRLADPIDAAPAAVTVAGPGGSVISLVEVELAGAPPELDRQEEIALEGLGQRFSPEAPVEVDGVEMWHLSGKESKGQYADVYGAVVDGTAVRLTIRLAETEYDEAERAAVNEQVLSSWSWA